MGMTEAEYLKFRMLFVELNDEDSQRVIAPVSKEDVKFQTDVLKAMKDFENTYGLPGDWLHKYDGDYLKYKALVLLGEYSKEGFLYDRI